MFSKRSLHFLHSITQHQQLETLLSMVIVDDKVNNYKFNFMLRGDEQNSTQYQIEHGWYSGHTISNRILCCLELTHWIKWAPWRANGHQQSKSSISSWQFFRHFSYNHLALTSSPKQFNYWYFAFCKFHINGFVQTSFWMNICIIVTHYSFGKTGKTEKLYVKIYNFLGYSQLSIW